MIMKKIIATALLLTLSSLVFAQVSWILINNPGVESEVTIESSDSEIAPIGMESAETEIRLPEGVEIPEDAQIPEDAPVLVATPAERAAFRDRVNEYLAERYPALLVIDMTIPAEVENIELSETEPSELSITPGNIYLEAELPFADINLGTCLQLIPLPNEIISIDAESSVLDLYELCDSEISDYTISATADSDGKFRFNIGKLLDRVDAGDISRLFVVKPFSSRDAFETPAAGATLFRIIRTI